MYKHKIILTLFLPFMALNTIRGQTQMLFEIGGSYFLNDIKNPNPQTQLNYFLALTLNPRVMLVQADNASLSVDLPMSIRSKSKDDRQIRFGTLLPALVMFNYGAGAVSKPNKNAIGFTAGAGWGYF